MSTRCRRARAIVALAWAGGAAWAGSGWADGAEPPGALVAYDLFTPSSLNPQLWTVSHNGVEPTDLDERRELIGGRLHLDTRSWAPSSLSLDLTNPGLVHAMHLC